MIKARAIEMFGSVTNLANAVGISRAAVYQWPEELPRLQADRVIAACVRRGIDPSPLLESNFAGVHPSSTSEGVGDPLPDARPIEAREC